MFNQPRIHKFFLSTIWTVSAAFQLGKASIHKMTNDKYVDEFDEILGTKISSSWYEYF